MAAKRKRKRAKRRANPTKKRATHRRKKRRANPAPARRRRRSHARRGSVHRRRVRRAHARRANPSPHRRGRSSHRRTHRRNPGGPLAQAAIGLALAAGAFVLTDVVTFYATSDMAKDGERNRKVLAAIAIGGGLYLAQKHPMIGLGIAAGGALSGFGNMLMLQVLKLLPPKQTGQTALKGLGAVAYQNLSAVYNENFGALALAGGNPGPAMLGAVSVDTMGGWEAMGDPIPQAPWNSDNPFGDSGGYG